MLKGVKNMNEENNVLTIKTVQIQPIRNVFTAIKDILADSTITFTKEGMKIINFDKTHTILVDVFLEAGEFEYYVCKPEKIVICANTLHLFRVISTISNDDTLTIYIENSDYHEGVVSNLGFQYENGTIRQCYSQKLRLIEPDLEELVIPYVVYTTVINLPSTDFQKIIRDLNCISDRIEICSIGKDLIFTAEGPFASLKIYRSAHDEHMEFIKNPSDVSTVIQGMFSLKSLSQFIKCTPLCNMIELNIDNNLPLIVSYEVATLGIIRLVLANLPPM